MRHAVIMAGGAGVRLWPLSRKSRPKQILKLFSGTSLLRQSYERVAALLPPEQIHVITSQRHLPIVAEEIPELPPPNLIGEPVGRDTAAAVGLASAIIAHNDPDATIGIFTADHIIAPVDAFCAAIEKAFDAAEHHSDALVTMGIRPIRPDTNYGYVWRGERLEDGVFKVNKFTEKPTMAKAMKYLATGEYYWNSGMFAWRAETILNQLKKHLTPSYDAVMELAHAWSTDARQECLERLYPNMRKISIDFAVMERAEKVLVIEMNCQWVDVGSWPALESVIQPDDDGNLAAASKVMHLGSKGNIVVTEDNHLIATIGVSDLVVIHSPDATLICKKRDAASIKELVDEVKGQFGEEYL